MPDPIDHLERDRATEVRANALAELAAPAVSWADVGAMAPRDHESVRSLGSLHRRRKRAEGLTHEMPEVGIGGRRHVLDPDCWCVPVIVGTRAMHHPERVQRSSPGQAP